MDVSPVASVRHRILNLGTTALGAQAIEVLLGASSWVEASGALAALRQLVVHHTDTVRPALCAPAPSVPAREACHTIATQYPGTSFSLTRLGLTLGVVAGRASCLWWWPRSRVCAAYRPRCELTHCGGHDHSHTGDVLRAGTGPRSAVKGVSTSGSTHSGWNQFRCCFAYQ